MKPYIVYLYFFIFYPQKAFSQVIFSSVITARNLTKDSRFISILLKVMVGNLNGILSRAICLWKNRCLVFPALRDCLFVINH